MSEEIKDLKQELNEFDEEYVKLYEKYCNLRNKNSNLQQKVEQLEKEVNEYKKELEKADSITQSCIFQGKQESKISFRNCLNRLEQLENIRKEAVDYVKQNCQIIRYKDEYGNLIDKIGEVNGYALLNILNKGSEE